MIQDLSDLSVLGKANQPLLAAMNGERAENNSAKTIRDKAYTLLKKAVDEIREAGKYVFWKNPDRLKGYYSARWTNR